MTEKRNGFTILKKFKAVTGRVICCTAAFRELRFGGKEQARADEKHLRAAGRKGRGALLEPDVRRALISDKVSG